MGDSPAPIPSPVSLLTLGSGWVGTYISSECTASGLTHAHTSRQGSATTIPFTFDPSSSDEAPYTLLPFACTVVIIFPVEGKGAHGHLIELYERTHPGCEARWVQLGSTSAFDVGLCLIVATILYVQLVLGEFLDLVAFLFEKDG